MFRQRLWRWLLAFCGWTLLGVFFASQLYISYAYSRNPITFAKALLYSMGEWYVWMALTPPILWLARRFPIERRAGRRTLLVGLLVHIPAGLFFVFLKLSLDALLPHVIPWLPARRFFPGQIHPNLVTYWVIVGLSHALDFYRRYRERELRASQLEARLAQAQLQMLKMQLHPHFLFNTLHAISALIHKDAEAADHMIARLSDLLRLTLESAGVQEVPLKQELEFLEPYLEIEQTRFQDRLQVGMDIDPAVLDALVPNLILQPLVENAIRHGVAPRSDPGRIEIRARRENESLRLEVRDNGPGLRQEALQEGLGLANTRARLEQLYGAEHRFELANATEGGLAVTLILPFREAAP